ncbi:MAG: ATP-dependent DNA helicase [bacterium]|nr:ATP-dependent DNA helicase [bacterium]
MSLAERSLALLAAATEALGSAGERRAGQEQMCAATAEAFERGRHLAVAAGTGTGKSLAYLIPAVLIDRRVVVATATKALQDQLATKELPFLAGLAETRRLRPGGRPFRWAVLKGRSNYICRQLVAEATRAGLQLELSDTGEANRPRDGADGPTGAGGAPASGAGDVARLLAWSDRATTGDRADVDWELPPGLWERLSVSAAQCPGRTRCPEGGACFAEAARERADRADIVVVNAHLLVLHLLGTPLLPPHDLVVIDEAHQFEETVTAIAGVSLAERSLRNAGQEVNAVIAQSGAPLANSGRRIAEILREHHGRRLPTDGPPELVEALTLASGRLEAVSAELRAAQPSGGDAEAQRLRALGEVSSLSESVAALLQRPGGTVAFVEGAPGAPELRLAHLEVGGLLREPLFEERTVVMTSATLGSATPTALGLEGDDYRHLDVGSPFDYRSAGLLYCATDLPPRNSPEFAPRAIDELETLINAAGGRTLALFTSHRMLEGAAGALRTRLRWPLLRQGDLPPAQLLERFAADDATCLFATIGFWQGVDVPGPALTLVTLDRLPFPRPDDPLLAARREHIGDDAFRLVDLRRAGILLAQGAGRLIRSEADRGVVAVLDPRLATARYRTELLEEVPPLRRTTERADVLDFLASL